MVREVAREKGGDQFCLCRLDAGRLRDLATALRPFDVIIVPPIRPLYAGAVFDNVSIIRAKNLSYLSADCNIWNVRPGPLSDGLVGIAAGFQEAVYVVHMAFVAVLNQNTVKGFCASVP